jgi:hypothetical protein
MTVLSNSSITLLIGSEFHSMLVVLCLRKPESLFPLGHMLATIVNVAPASPKTNHPIANIRK